MCLDCLLVSRKCRVSPVQYLDIATVKKPCCSLIRAPVVAAGCKGFKGVCSHLGVRPSRATRGSWCSRSFLHSRSSMMSRSKQSPSGPRFLKRHDRMTGSRGSMRGALPLRVTIAHRIPAVFASLHALVFRPPGSFLFRLHLELLQFLHCLHLSHRILLLRPGSQHFLMLRPGNLDRLFLFLVSNIK
jgi:hypothetical protein